VRASYCSQELNDLLDNKEHRLERASSEPFSARIVPLVAGSLIGAPFTRSRPSLPSLS